VFKSDIGPPTDELLRASLPVLRATPVVSIFTNVNLLLVWCSSKDEYLNLSHSFDLCIAFFLQDPNNSELVDNIENVTNASW